MSCLRLTLEEPVEALRFQDVLAHPRNERVTVSRDRVPFLVEGIVALVVAVRVRGGCASGRRRDSADHPGWQNDGITRRVDAEVVNDLLDRDDGASRGQNGLFLNAGNAPEENI